MWISKKKFKEIESRLSTLECKQKAMIPTKGKVIITPKHQSSVEDHYNHGKHKHQ